MNARRWMIGACAFVLFAAPAFAQQSQPAGVGRIKIASGAAFIVRAGAQIPAQPGAVVYESDSLRTGGDGRIGVTLKDDTRVSLGPSSEARLARFVYVPSESRLGFVLSVARGVVAYVSGRIAKLAPDAVRLETPGAVVGVRGTALAVRVSAE